MGVVRWLRDRRAAARFRRLVGTIGADAPHDLLIREGWTPGPSRYDGERATRVYLKGDATLAISRPATGPSRRYPS